MLSQPEALAYHFDQPAHSAICSGCMLMPAKPSSMHRVNVTFQTCRDVWCRSLATSPWSTAVTPPRADTSCQVSLLLQLVSLALVILTSIDAVSYMFARPGSRCFLLFAGFCLCISACPVYCAAVQPGLLPRYKRLVLT